MHEKHEESFMDYWFENPKRWKKVLQMAADYAAMYELEAPVKYELERVHPRTLAKMFFWNTTHRKDPSVTRADPLVECEPDLDAPTCWACITGEARTMSISRLEMPFVLQTSAYRIHKGWKLWDGFTEDFRIAVRGLRGDMAGKAMRSFVLGDDWRRPNG